VLLRRNIAVNRLYGFRSVRVLLQTYRC